MCSMTNVGVTSLGSPLFPGSNCASSVAQKGKYSSSIVSSAETGLDSSISPILNQINCLFWPIVCFHLWAAWEVSTISPNSSRFLCQGNSTCSWTADKYVIQSETVKFTRQLFTQQRIHPQLNLQKVKLNNNPIHAKTWCFVSFKFQVIEVSQINERIRF